MMTDTEIKARGIRILITELGSVGMEKFIALIQREPFDYTEWQRDQWNEYSVEELSKNAMQYSKTVNNENG